MKDCIFCQIIEGKIPCHKVYEDSLFLGFLDIKPLSLGNSLLIPKKHYRWVNDVPEFGLYWEAAKKIAATTIPLVKADYVSFLTLGMEVPHAHIRIIPRFINDGHTHGIDTNIIIDSSNEAMEALSHEIITNTNFRN
jgi:histidine triad (HIT) family protein